jgi:uncharacterized surface protein with fasciclin (FAS1) repeats
MRSNTMTARAAHRLAAPMLAAVAGTLLIAGCSGGGDDADDRSAAEPGTETLAALVAQADDFSVVSATLKDAGLAEVFDGAAAYTMLAPRDAAFEALGDAGETLRSPEQRPAMVAVLRDHIVPGYLTPDDIAKAVELDDDGKVAMRTMAGHTLTFADDGGTLTATGEDGTTVRFAGDALLASNGVAIPVDGLAVKVAAADGS